MGPAPVAGKRRWDMPTKSIAVRLTPQCRKASKGIAILLALSLPVIMLLQACRAVPGLKELPTFTPRPTRTSLPTHTPLPATPTATSTPKPLAFPLLPGTALPAMPEPISLENAGRVIELANWPVQGSPESLTWSPDGRWLALSLSNAIQIYAQDLVQAGIILLPTTSQARPIFSQDGKFLAALLKGSILSVWNVPTGEQVYSHATDIRSGPDLQLGQFIQFVHGSPIFTMLSGGELSLVHLESAQVRSYPGIRGYDLSPDGRILAVSPSDQDLNLYRTEDGVLLRKIHFDSGQIFDFFFSQDGQALFFDFFDGNSGKFSIKVIRISDGSLMGSLSYEGSGNLEHTARLLPTGKVLLLRSILDQGKNQYKTVLQLYRTGDWQPILRVENNDFEVSPDGATLATVNKSPQGDEKNDIRLWRLEDAKLTATIPGIKYEITALAFSPDNAHLAIAGSDERIVRIYDLTGQELSHISDKIGSCQWQDCIVFSPAGNDPYLTMIGQDGSVKAWRAAGGSLLKTLHEEKDAAEIAQIAFSADGASLAFLGRTNTGTAYYHGCTFNGFYINQISSLRLLDGKPGSSIALDPGRAAYLFSPDGRSLAEMKIPEDGSSGDCTLQLLPAFRQDQGIPIMTFHNAYPLKYGFLANGAAFWIAYSLPTDNVDVFLEFFDPNDGSQLKKATFNLTQIPVNDGNAANPTLTSPYEFDILAISPDGEFIVSRAGTLAGRISRVDLWHRGEAAPFHNFANPSGGGLAAFSPDGKYLAMKVDNQPLQIFSVADARLIREIGAPKAFYRQLLFSMDGQVIIARDDTSLELWGVAAGTRLARFESPDRFSSEAVLSPDGRYLATSLSAGMLQLWGVAP